LKICGHFDTMRHTSYVSKRIEANVDVIRVNMARLVPHTRRA
jgi:hypothetical protein